MKSKRQLLIMISGSPWVGKTTCARDIFMSLDNSAWLDGDNVWQVNPFSIEDPRLRNADRNMSFVLRTYLESKFDYIIFSTVVLTEKWITDGILEGIGVKGYDLMFFMLSCSESALKARSTKRDNKTDPESRYLHAAKRQDAIHIDTTNMTPKETVHFILNIVRNPRAAGLVPISRRGIREWKRKDTNNNTLNY